MYDYGDDLDLDWGNIPNFEKENEDFLRNELPRVVRLHQLPEEELVVTKSWAEYAKDINRLRASLRYMKKSLDYTSPYGYDQKDILEVEFEIKKLKKLRDCAKAMEKSAGYKMGEIDKK